MIQKISNDLDVNVIKSKSNLGIAEALNQGFEYFKFSMKTVSGC